MSSVQFTTLIRLPFARGSFEDPPQAQWDGERDRQLWKIISKSSKTSDLNWVDLASKFQVPPTFLLQQAAWLYERHLDHVRNQMKKVSGSNVPTVSTSGASTLASTGGYAMHRTGSAGSGAPRTTPVFPAKSKENPNLRGGETFVPGEAPPLSRTPSTNTITQSRANNQQVPARSQSTRSAQRPSLSSPSQEERRRSTHDAPPHSELSQELAESPGLPDSSSSSSSGSEVDLPTHRSQLFKRPPRFKPQKSEGLSTFDEDDGNQAGGGSTGHGQSNLPFATAARQSAGQKYAQDTFFRTSSKREPKSLADRNKFAASPRQKLADQRKQSTTETVSPMTSPASTTDAPTPSDVTKSPMSPASNHRVDLGRLGSPRQRDTRPRREGSEGTPSMGSSFSDIDDAGISQSALEEALLSNMQHGRMSTLSRMSRYL